MMSGAKAPDFDAYGLLRATHILIKSVKELLIYEP